MEMFLFLLACYKFILKLYYNLLSKWFDLLELLLKIQRSILLFFLVSLKYFITKMRKPTPRNEKKFGCTDYLHSDQALLFFSCVYRSCVYIGLEMRVS